MKIRLHETITVERPLADCFRYVKDFSTIEQWDPGVYRSTKCTPGAVRAGSEFDLLLNVSGRRVPMRYTLRQMQDQKELLLEGEGDSLHALDRISFRALSASSTEIDYVADLTLGVLPGWSTPLLKPAFKRLGVKAVTGLKTALELPERAGSGGLMAGIKDRLILPAAWDFTERGYLAMPRKGLSEFVDGKRVLITGPTSGLGLAAACELSRLGAELILVGRDEQRLADARDAVLAFSGAAPDSIDLFAAELSLESEVKRVAALIRQQYAHIDVLINNAGALFPERGETVEGNERSLAINLLAPYWLTSELMDLLVAAKGRVINVASGGMYLQGLRLDDMQYERGSYDGSKAYARAKRALVALTEDWAEQYRSQGVDFHVMHPGWAATPGVSKSLPGFEARMAKYLRDARMGADTIVWLASASEVEGVSGNFWFDRAPHTTSVLPGTAVSSGEREQLWQFLQGTQECTTANLSQA